MSTFITRNQAREIDQRALDEFGLPGAILMENAARGCVDVLQELGISGPVVVCCGRGNNGGDGFAMARRLDLLGYATKILSWSDPGSLRGDAALNYEIVRKSGIPLVDCPGIDAASWLAPHLTGADWIVDALLGTGSQGPLRPPFLGVIRTLNGLPARRLAVDLPSGLDCDTGVPAEPTFRADHTCTFVAPKIGFRNPLAQPYLGTVHVLDIGAPRKLVEAVLKGAPVPDYRSRVT